MSSNYTRKDIITLPNPNLRKKSSKVHVITEDTVQLAEDMISAAIDWENSRPHEMAVALAAVQINRLEKVIILRSDFDNKDNQDFTVLINPKVVKYEGEILTDQEGCLSVKDIYGLVPRYSKVRVEATDLQGRKVKFKSPNEFVARILQHEVDHCDGKCFVDHITHEKNAFSILNKEGDLIPIEYDKVVKMGILKDE